jgi:hypothetical protein
VSTGTFTILYSVMGVSVGSPRGHFQHGAENLDLHGVEQYKLPQTYSEEIAAVMELDEAI